MSSPGARRTAQELRQLILDAGLAVLYRTGLRATASHVPMTEALAELEQTHGIKVSTGSIFGRGRIWPSVKEFQIDLLREALADPTGDGPNDGSRSLIEYLPDVRGEPFESRIDTFVELCRIAGGLNGYVAEPGKVRIWTIWVGIWSTAMSDPEIADALLDPLRSAERLSMRQFGALYEAMLEKLGMRLKHVYTMDQFATLAASITDGIALRTNLVPGVTATARSHRNEADWNLLGIGLMAIATELVEDNPAETDASPD